MLIPSIDLMGGKIVQLVQGDKKALEFENFEEWIARFSAFPLVQLIDLDAAKSERPNTERIAELVKRLPCQVGGGIRSINAARTLLDAGARRVILGSALIVNGEINVPLAQAFAEELDPERLVFAIDTKGGRVAIRGWREITAISPLEMVKALDPFCGAFLYTHIDTEGLMKGLPLEPVLQVRRATSRQVIAAGGIASYDEIAHLDEIGVDAVVGMALYSDRLNLRDLTPVSR